MKVITQVTNTIKERPITVDEFDSYFKDIQDTLNGIKDTLNTALIAQQLKAQEKTIRANAIKEAQTIIDNLMNTLQNSDVVKTISDMEKTVAQLKSQIEKSASGSASASASASGSASASASANGSASGSSNSSN